MPFRVLVIGPPVFRDYPRLREVLDLVLVNRVPDVELLTVGGSGLPSLVASYARMRKLEFRSVPLEQQSYPVEQLSPKNLELVLLADAAVFFWSDSGGECYVLAKEMKARGKPVHVVSRSAAVRSVEPPRVWRHPDMPPD
ncbi:MAG TPA: SLOG family protein [Gemmata sp.]|nr:SLOG family protein [Gemmata sp.]